MSYGIAIQPDDGARPVDITASSRLPSFVSNVVVAGAKNQTVSYNLSLASGAQSFVLPRRTLYMYDDPISGIPIESYINGIGFSGTTLNVNTWNSMLGSVTLQAGNIDVYQILPAANNSGWGIALQDASNFMSITDASQLGYVTWRGVISFKGSWDIPLNIPNRASCAVFARWQNTNVSLYFNRDSMRLEAFVGGSNFDMSMTGTISNIQLCIVSSGFYPDSPSSGYGLVIRNSKGQNTYSSKYPPLIWRGGYWDCPDGWGTAGRYVACNGNVSQPMIPLCSLGVHSTDPSTGGMYPQKKYHLTGMLMNGGSVALWRAKPDLYYARDYLQSSRSVAVRIPVIDAADYF